MNRQYQNLEEQRFAEWLQELKTNGFVSDWCLCEEPFVLIPKQNLIWKQQLKTKVKEVTISACHQQTYLPDFKIIWNEKSKGLLYTPVNEIAENKGIFISIEGVTFVDVKGTFFGKNASDVRFSLKQALFLQRWNSYVQKCSPFSIKKKNKIKKGLFQNTFAPKTWLDDKHNYYQRTEKKGSLKFNMIDIDTWMKKNKKQ